MLVGRDRRDALRRGALSHGGVSVSAVVCCVSDAGIGRVEWDAVVVVRAVLRRGPRSGA